VRKPGKKGHGQAMEVCVGDILRKRLMVFYIPLLMFLVALLLPFYRMLVTHCKFLGAISFGIMLFIPLWVSLSASLLMAYFKTIARFS
jgi:hypothetical protein